MSAGAWRPCECKESQLPGEEVKMFFHLFLPDSGFLITLVLPFVICLTLFLCIH